MRTTMEDLSMTTTGTLTPAARAFADACHTNALDELREALRGPADEPDCRTWGLTAEEWRAAIETAIREREQEG